MAQNEHRVHFKPSHLQSVQTALLHSQLGPQHTCCNTQTHIKPNATENMERAHQNEHSKRANATQVKDTLNTMPGGELK